MPYLIHISDAELLAGSIYLIILIAALELRRDFSNLTVIQTTEIAKAFRSPPPGNIDCIITLPLLIIFSDLQWDVLMTKVLIPRLRWLQLYGVPVSFVNQLFWNPDELDPTIRCYMQLSDLEVSDKVLGGILMK